VTAALLSQPWALTLLPLAVVAWFAARRAEDARERRLRDGLGPRRAALAPTAEPRARRTARALLCASIVAAALAATRPAWGVATERPERAGIDLVLCLDVSRSMRARDVAPDRATRAREEIAALAERATGDRLALVAFAGDARVVVPPTRDARSVARMAEVAAADEGGKPGSDVGAAIDAAAALLADAPPGGAAILVLTDGEDLGGRGLLAAGRSGDRGIPVFPVTFATALGGKIAEEGGSYVRDESGADVVSRPDAAALDAIARTSGGSVIDAGAEPGALARARDEAASRAAVRAREAASRDEPAERFQVPLLAAVLLWMAEAVLRARRRT
jgi:Ca-activated chloride channel family protein